MQNNIQGTQYLRGIASHCILIHLSLQHKRQYRSSLRGNMELPLLVTIYALRSLSTYLHPAVIAVILLGWTAHISFLKYKVLVSYKV